MRLALILSLPILLCTGFVGCDDDHAEKREQPSPSSITLNVGPPMISEQFTLLPCPAKPKSTLAYEGCAERRILRSDKAINERARVIYDNLSATGRARFVKAERAWLTYRRALCESRADLYYGGSAATLVFAKCVADENDAHLKELRAFERGLGRS
jgi:uncharacterized protein YecT (DUF1311 family)